ncbi:MAG: hypothetical protein R2932_40985 [Caldilineaceae bacterium]
MARAPAAARKLNGEARHLFVPRPTVERTAAGDNGNLCHVATQKWMGCQRIAYPPSNDVIGGIPVYVPYISSIIQSSNVRAVQREKQRFIFSHIRTFVATV